MAYPNLRECVPTVLCKKPRCVSPNMCSPNQKYIKIRPDKIVVILVPIMTVLTVVDYVLPRYKSGQEMVSSQYFTRRSDN